MGIQTDVEYMQGKQERLAENIKAWQEHCKTVGHVPYNEGGTALYDTSISGRYIRCCEKKCKWQNELA